MRKKNLMLKVLSIILCLFLPGLCVSAKGQAEINLIYNEKAVEGVTFKVYPLADSGDEQLFLDENRDLSDALMKEKYGEPFLVGPSSKEGIIDVDLPVGKYYFREEKESDLCFVFILDIRKEDNITKVYPKQYGRGSVRLKKKSVDGKKLTGAEFQLYRRCEKKIFPVPLKDLSYNRNEGQINKKLKTDDKGVLEIKNLPCGKYFFKETKAPKGYVLCSEEIDFEIEKDRLVEVICENRKENLGGITFRKIDAKTEEALKGACFAVKRKKGDRFVAVQGHSEVVSDERGLFKVYNLPYGKYFLFETKAPDGYSKLRGPVEFKIDSESHDKVIIIKNDKQGKRILSGDAPKTGSISVFIMTVIGTGLCFAGLKLMHEGRRRQ